LILLRQTGRQNKDSVKNRNLTNLANAALVLQPGIQIRERSDFPDCLQIAGGSGSHLPARHRRPARNRGFSRLFLSC
jgi:hypothetical protein